MNGGVTGLFIGGYASGEHVHGGVVDNFAHALRFPAGTTCHRATIPIHKHCLVDQYQWF